MTRYRGLPCRFVWGDQYDQIVDVAGGLDEALAYPLPRDGSDWAIGTAGDALAWRTGTDYYLEGKARFIPTDGSTLGTMYGVRHTGWDEANGWRAMLEWARWKNPLRFFPDARNLLTSPRLNSDGDADGVPDGWLSYGTPSAANCSRAVDAGEQALKVAVLAGGNTGAAANVGCYQRFAATQVVTGEKLTVSGEVRLNGPANGSYGRVMIYAYDAALKSLGSVGAVQAADTGTGYVRIAATQATPAGTAWIYAYVALYVPANTATLSAGTVWLRNVQLERGAVASSAFIDQPGYRAAYLVAPTEGRPERDDNGMRRVPLVLRAADRAPFTGY